MKPGQRPISGKPRVPGRTALPGWAPTGARATGQPDLRPVPVRITRRAGLAGVADTAPADLLALDLLAVDPVAVGPVLADTVLADTVGRPARVTELTRPSGAGRVPAGCTGRAGRTPAAPTVTREAGPADRYPAGPEGRACRRPAPGPKAPVRPDPARLGRGQPGWGVLPLAASMARRPARPTGHGSHSGQSRRGRSTRDPFPAAWCRAAWCRAAHLRLTGRMTVMGETAPGRGSRIRAGPTPPGRAARSTVAGPTAPDQPGACPTAAVTRAAARRPTTSPTSPSSSPAARCSPARCRLRRFRLGRSRPDRPDGCLLPRRSSLARPLVSSGLATPARPDPRTSDRRRAPASSPPAPASRTADRLHRGSSLTPVSPLLPVSSAPECRTADRLVRDSSPTLVSSLPPASSTPVCRPPGRGPASRFPGRLDTARLVSSVSPVGSVSLVSSVSPGPAGQFPPGGQAPPGWAEVGPLPPGSFPPGAFATGAPGDPAARYRARGPIDGGSAVAEGGSGTARSIDDDGDRVLTPTTIYAPGSLITSPEADEVGPGGAPGGPSAPPPTAGPVPQTRMDARSAHQAGARVGHRSQSDRDQLGQEFRPAATVASTRSSHTPCPSNAAA